MITCLGDMFRPDVGVAAVRLLRRLGITVAFPESQTCCGQPFFNSGYSRHAQEIAKHTITVFQDSETVVVPSGSCAAMVKLEYPALFRDDPVWYERAVNLGKRTYEITYFLVNVLESVDVGATFKGKVTYHFACHLRAMEMQDEAVQLIKSIRGAEYVPLEGIQDCCGFGGSFSVRFPEVSGAIVQDKAQAILRSGADVVVSTDTGCLMNIAGRLHRIGSAVRSAHLVELLAGDVR